MKKLKSAIKRFFFPPEGTPLWVRILPYAVLGVLTIAVLFSSVYAWDYTNSPEFCGQACHTMPPEYTAYLTSPHARVDCVDCHIGEGFITTRITRKAGDAKHIIRLAFHDYEFPITAEEMRPARETCELCHFPEKFSDDSLREIKHFGNDTYNTPSSTYLVMKTGGGTKREGLGQGIHWHIENPVNYYASDHAESEIPYVQVVVDDGSIKEYFDIEANLDPSQITSEDLKEMDCITCHNRITHLVKPPEEILDQLLDRGVISPEIPDIRRQAVDLFYRPYKTQEEGIVSIAGLENYYKQYYPDFYDENHNLVEEAISTLQSAYAQSVYPEQKSDWDSHPNHAGHIYSPGCFRCHDGKHLSEEQEAIRLECNVCHSIPVVAGESDFVTNIQVSRGPEPASHLNSNWISMHRDVFDQTCQNCHTTEDPGGTSNTSFCSNSACHGSVYEYAGFDAPALREILVEQLPEPETVVIENEVTEGDDLTEGLDADLKDETATYENNVGALLIQRCGSCHGENAMVGLDLRTYESAMAGGNNGPAIVPGDSAESQLVQIQSGEQTHFGQFSTEELGLVIQWIDLGAPEK